MSKALSEQHQPVMVEEVFQLLQPALMANDALFVDCTLGLGGHSEYFLKHLEKLKVVGFDQDQIALSRAQTRLKDFNNRIIFIHSNFERLSQELNNVAINSVNAFLFDLGVSSIQIDEKSRGFSYLDENKLDMRMDQTQTFSAKELINEWSEAEISKVLFEFGEEKFAKKIAKNIMKDREIAPIETTAQLVALIEKSIPAPARRSGGNPAKRTFQALRIAVNQELEVLKKALADALTLLKPGGRIAVLSYHSLEDRIVKELFKSQIAKSELPRKLPVVESLSQNFRLLNTKPMKPSFQEIEFNSRSKSAKLRGIEKLDVAA
ncbi:MAG: 16S rRNA (cytosine(1402)-N(4))-methyltransferase RsmH [Candidatus Nanopelagicales bacterium]